MTAISNLRCEYRENPLGIDVLQPRLSWQLATDRQGARQTAYHILAATSPDKLTSDAADVWNSGKVESDQSVQVTYAGEALSSRQRVFWKVTVWDETGASSESDLAWFEMGLLNPGDWQAEWISANLVGSPHAAVPVPYFRKEFATQGAIKSARLYVTSLGVFECSINGQLVGDDVLSPGWTDFCKRIRYSVYDVTNHLQSGENAFGAMVGDGWAVGHVGMGARQAYSQKPCLLAQLEITLTDGSKQIIVSNSSWKHQFGPIVESDIMHGESYDARLEMPGWDKTGFDDSTWLPVAVQPDNGAQRVAANGPMVKRIEELSPIEKPSTTFHISGPVHVFDLGQNMVGRVRFKGSALAGTTVTLRYAEVLNADGSIYTTNLRGARVTDYYTFKGEGEEVWEPRFTFHGFRYVELRGYAGQVDINTITGVVLHSDMPATGDFSCSDELINQLQHNIQWGQKGNFLDVPTDCPQRDERLGWTGDIQVFVQTAAFNMHVAGFMTKWAKDVADAQNEQGMVPAVVPQAIGDLPDGGPAWADAAVVCPWTIYQSYGDKSILAENYDVMVGFIDYLVAS
ncbi:MAG: family 78 glycoside hydrolase catalytic domain, partial [Anaerolineae bacterium]|nr:family 78 glycoside hydrolase catalytic domain [Anaerolineae bacterium]